jgi:hypothetical protein
MFGASASANDVQNGAYIVINLAAGSQPVIDWSATGSGSVGDSSGGNWLSTQLAGSFAASDLLALQTGLAIRRD